MAPAAISENIQYLLQFRQLAYLLWGFPLALYPFSGLLDSRQSGLRLVLWLLFGNLRSDRSRLAAHLLGVRVLQWAALPIAGSPALERRARDLQELAQRQDWLGSSRISFGRGRPSPIGCYLSFLDLVFFYVLYCQASV